MHSPHRPLHPFRVTLLMVAVFLLGGWQLWQGALYWRQFKILRPYGPSVDLRALGVIALVWGGVFVTAAVFQYYRPVSTRWLPALLWLFFVYIGVVRIIFQPGRGRPIDWLVAVLTAMLIPLGIRWLLNSPATSQRTEDGPGPAPKSSI